MTFRATNEQMFNREVWLQALESGEWEQSRQCLLAVSQRGYAFCCLGVAEACRQDGVPDSDSVLLSADGRDWLGLRAEDPKLPNGLSCVKANDVERWTFAWIAKALRPLLARRDYDGTNP